jgi:hypothetical protein
MEAREQLMLDYLAAWKDRDAERVSAAHGKDFTAVGGFSALSRLR